MTLVSLIPHSVRPQAEAQILGVGRGSGSSLSDLFKMGTSNSHLVDLRGRSDVASGSASRALYARLHFYGTGEGEAVRAYSNVNVASAATGGSIHGLHASLAVAASASISGQGFGGRFTIDEAADTRTVSGNIGAILAESNFATGNTIPATVALVHFKEIGAVACKKAFRFPTIASAGMVAAHVTDAMTHSVRCVDDAGTVFYLMATTTSSNRTGGA